MSKIIHAAGNLIDMAEKGAFDVIVHGANCHNTMGSGIAREIRARYPAAYATDCQTTPGDYNKLGNYTSAVVDNGGFIIVNAYTQFNFNARGCNVDLFEYAAFGLILQKLAHRWGTERFGFPRIGQGLAGGDPVRIDKMLEEFADMVTVKGGSVTLVDYQQV
jgi:O-acetyl-ADP-ribose deacetylase (regulator of RNase III)